MASNFHMNKVESLVKKTLPKVIERFNAQNNFELPDFTINKLEGWPSNFFQVSMHNDTPRFGTVSVDVDVEVKDGRLGRLKKLINKLVEQCLSSLGYEYDEVYVDFYTYVSVQKNADALRKFLTTFKTHKGWYSLPYSDSYDDGVDWKVEYDVKLSDIQKPKTRGNGECQLMVKLELIVFEILVGNEESNEWENYYHIGDLPEHSWDEITDEIVTKIGNMIPHLCIEDIKFVFKTK